MDCIFCKIENKETDAWIVYDDSKIIAFFDKGSATEGHTLIVPKMHYENIYDIPEVLLKEAIAVTKELAILYKKKLNAKALDIVHASGKEAGQDVFHFHIHLIPRYSDDGINEHNWWKSNHQTKYSFDDVLKKIKS